MPIWTNEYLNRITLEAEVEIAKAVPCIIDRLSIPVEQGIPSYILPEYVTNVRKILWKGSRLDPMSYGEFADWIYTLSSTQGAAFNPRAFSKSFHLGDIVGGTPMSKPMRYFYSNFGENAITFNPNVHEDVAAVGSNLFSSAIGNSVIIEFYRAPDGVNFKIPHYIRRRTIKNYVLWKAFLKEGNGQNIQASEYYRGRFEICLGKARAIIERIYTSTANRRTQQSIDNGYKVARPVLPWNYGTVVEDDYD
jgi:hypothetical protein